MRHLLPCPQNYTGSSAEWGSLTSNQRWKFKNKEIIPAKRKIHYSKNRDAILAHSKEYKKTDEFKLKRKEYDKHNLESKRASQHKYKKKVQANFFQMFGLGLGM
jgi:hypothetical protein